MVAREGTDATLLHQPLLRNPYNANAGVCACWVGWLVGCSSSSILHSPAASKVSYVGTLAALARGPVLCLSVAAPVFVLADCE